MATEEADPADYPDDEPADEESPMEAEEEKSDKPDVRSTEDRTIFVKGLPFTATVDQIKVLFVNATEVRLLTKNNGQSRGKAFVEMKSVETAESASKFKGWSLGGRQLGCPQKIFRIFFGLIL